MNRITTLVRSSFVALILIAGAISTGCTSVRENQVDAMTGQVNTVNRRQFFVKSFFNKGNKTTYMNGDPQLASQTAAGANNFNPQEYASRSTQGQYAPQYAPQIATQYAPQNAPQYAPRNAQYAPQYAPQQQPTNASGMQQSPFGQMGR